MNAPLPSVPLPVRVLFLSRSESMVRTDTKLLRSLGVSAITHISDSSQAKAFLEKNFQNAQPDSTNSVDIVISDEHLADAPASVFLYGLAQHPNLKNQPVLVLTGTAESSRRLRSAGVYLLERPYTAQGLARMLQKATSPVRRALKPEAFESASAQKGIPLLPRPQKPKPTAAPPATTSDWYKKGMESLHRGDLRAAESAFIRVLDRQEDHTEAALGLAKVFQARADEKGMLRCLLRAAAASLRQEDHIRAAHITALLPPNMRDRVFFHEALARMEEGEYKAAALGFLDAGKENTRIPLHHLISRACQLTSKPEECMRRICAALAGMGYKATAERLHQRLLIYPDFTPEEPRSWLDNYPKLKEAMNIISYTAWIWKHA